MDVVLQVASWVVFMKMASLERRCWLLVWFVRCGLPTAYWLSVVIALCIVCVFGEGVAFDARTRCLALLDAVHVCVGWTVQDGCQAGNIMIRASRCIVQYLCGSNVRRGRNLMARPVWQDPSATWSEPASGRRLTAAQTRDSLAQTITSMYAWLCQPLAQEHIVMLCAVAMTEGGDGPGCAVRMVLHAMHALQLLANWRASCMCLHVHP